MRVKIELNASRLPLSYRSGILSFIKEALIQEDAIYYEKVFGGKQRTKRFAYAVFLRKFQIDGDCINLEGFTITLSSSDIEFMLHIVNGIRKLKEFQYRSFVWAVEQVSILPEKKIESSKVLFRTLSPILIEDRTGKPVSPYASNYEQEFNYYAEIVVQACLDRHLKQHVVVKPLDMKKMVVKEKNSGLQNVDQVLYFTPYSGTLLLEGHPDDLNCFNENGISKRRSYGFGLLEIEIEMEGRG